MHDEEKKVCHPSFGNIQINRVSGHTNLYDSPLHHGHFISLRISTASYQRDLYRRWHMPEEMIVEVYMSASQFAEAITNMNTTGVPCTVRRYRDKTGKFVESSLDSPDNDKDTHEQEIKNAVASLAVRARKAQEQLDEALQGKTVRKGDLEALKGTLYKLEQDLRENLPFVQRSFYEAMEKVEQRVKTEIVALADHVVHSRGLAALGIESGAQLMGAQPTGLLGPASVDVDVDFTDEELDQIEEEVDRRTRSDLQEGGEDGDSDSDHAMYLRHDYRSQVMEEFEKRKKGDGDDP